MKIKISNIHPRRDIQGNILDVHDGCLHFFEGRYYLYGTSYGDTNGLTYTNRYLVYSSPDLAAWTLEGDLIDSLPRGLFYRPYIAYNAKRRKYVLWFNWYPKLWEAKYGVAESDTPQGPYHIVKDEVALGFEQPGDLGLFVDDDGTAFLTYTSIKNDHGVTVEQLDENYTASTKKNCGAIAVDCESPAMFKRQGLYYLLFDNTCFFCPAGSGARVYTSQNPLGPWTERGNINRSKDGRTLITAQQTHIARLPSPTGDVYLWMGDRWSSSPDGSKAHDFQYWSSPLKFKEDGMIEVLSWENEWSGEISPGR